jgi:rRNA maturation endonuclease Nob1
MSKNPLKRQRHIVTDTSKMYNNTCNSTNDIMCSYNVDILNEYLDVMQEISNVSTTLSESKKKELNKCVEKCIKKAGRTKNISKSDIKNLKLCIENTRSIDQNTFLKSLLCIFVIIIIIFLLHYYS